MERKREVWRAYMHKEMRRGMLNMLILWNLKKKGGKMYGYEIIQLIQSKTKGMWTPKAGTIYPILRRLETRGFVESTWTAKAAGGPSRRYYKITKEGEKAVKTVFREWKKLASGFGEFLHELFGVD